MIHINIIMGLIDLIILPLLLGLSSSLFVHERWKLGILALIIVLVFGLVVIFMVGTTFIVLNTVTSLYYVVVINIFYLLGFNIRFKKK